MSTLAVATIKSASSAPVVFQNTSGTEVIQGARVWVNFNQSSTQSIRDSFNVSSIEDLGTGQTKVNFSNNFSNNEYAVVCGGSRDQPEGSRCFPSNIDGMTTAKFEVTNHNDGSTLVDWTLVTIACFGE